MKNEIGISEKRKEKLHFTEYRLIFSFFQKLKVKRFGNNGRICRKRDLESSNVSENNTKNKFKRRLLEKIILSAG